MFVEVAGPARDLHSGVFGRTVHEPMTALIALLGKLVAPDGTILVPGVDDMVHSADSEERYGACQTIFQPSAADFSPNRALYDRLDYSIADIDDAVGAPIALSDDKIQVLMGRMRQPSLSIHGIEGAFYGSGAKTVIPAKVTGKFSIRFAVACFSGKGTD